MYLQVYLLCWTVHSWHCSLTNCATKKNRNPETLRARMLPTTITLHANYAMFIQSSSANWEQFDTKTIKPLNYTKSTVWRKKSPWLSKPVGNCLECLASSSAPQVLSVVHQTFWDQTQFHWLTACLLIARPELLICNLSSLLLSRTSGLWARVNVAFQAATQKIVKCFSHIKTEVLHEK